MSEVLKSEDIKCLPLGSKMIVRAYLKTQGIILNLNHKEIVPCVEVMKVGPDVKHVQEGKWVLIRDGITPGQFKYGDELFYFVQEHDVTVIFDEKPDYEMIMGTNTSIVRDLTEYVKVDKLSKVKAKISEKDESEVLTESTTILDPDGNPVG
jgi:threonine dehydrogenase-like Zn-dependent dehydrogenase